VALYPHFPIRLRDIWLSTGTTLSLLLSSSLISGILSPGISPLEQWRTRPHRFQVSDCSTSPVMCDMPNTADYVDNNKLSAGTTQSFNTVNTKPTIRQDPEPVPSTSHPRKQFSRYPSQCYPPIYISVSRWLFSKRFPHQMCVCISCLNLQSICLPSTP